MVSGRGAGQWVSLNFSPDSGGGAIQEGDLPFLGSGTVRGDRQEKRTTSVEN